MIGNSMFREMKYEYPHPDFDFSVKLVVEDALRMAWNRLGENQSRYNVDLNICGEDDVSIRLQDILEDIIQTGCIPGFTADIFQTVSRGENLSNFNGGHINKQPDLIFRLKDTAPGVNRVYYGIFVECKPIDEKHTIGKTYCNEGVIRFVNGDYAWAMPCGMMVGYVRSNSYNISGNLTTTLENPKYSNLCTVGSPTECSKSKNNPSVYITEHQRNWVHTNGKPPGNIILRHLWLSVKNLNS